MDIIEQIEIAYNLYLLQRQQLRDKIRFQREAFGAAEPALQAAIKVGVPSWHSSYNKFKQLQELQIMGQRDELIEGKTNEALEKSIKEFKLNNF